MSSLKRRFSSGDLDSEFDDGEEIRQRQLRNVTSQQQQQQQPQQHHEKQAPLTPANSVVSSGQPQPPQQQQQQQQQQEGGGSGFAFSGFRTASRITSAPTSPSKSRESFLQRVQSLTAGVTNRPEASSRPAFNKDRCFNLLVIDDQNTDWSKYFRGRQIHGDYDIRVEQAEFSEITITGSTQTGSNVTIVTHRGGQRVHVSFRPHFVLVRQNIRDQPDDFKNSLLGLMYDDVPAINNLEVIYNFQDKPWVFAHLVQLQKKLGRNVFPLIKQNYFPNHREMMSDPLVPSVFKVGHAHSGGGKVRVQSKTEYEDMTSIVAIAGSYCTTEPLIEAKYDLHVQKIGSNYKAFMRKSMSGGWKTNVGAAMLEQLPVNERYRTWLQEASKLFGGMDMCSVEALVDQQGLEHIIELNDSALPLMGDTQEEDRRHIVELVCAKMQYCCRLPNATENAAEAEPVNPSSATKVPPPRPPRPEDPPLSAHSTSDLAEQKRRDSQASQKTTASGSVARAGSIGGDLESTRRSSSSEQTTSTKMTRQGSSQQAEGKSGDETEDTMTNLRKTFAGIFGDM